MSVFVVNVQESYVSGQQGNPRLRELASLFNGSIFHRDPTYGSFMVHGQDGLTSAEQIQRARAHFQQQGISVQERANTAGHVIFEVDLTQPVPVLG